MLNFTKKRIKTFGLLNKIMVFAFIYSSVSAIVFANPVIDENQNPGTRDWVLSADSNVAASDDVGQIKGYMSATSVNKGGNIDFKVSVDQPQNFTIKIYRAGYYEGNGGRFMQTIGPLPGITQDPCSHDKVSGMVECNWSISYTLTVPSNWTSGIYLAKLTNQNGFESGTIFVVRDDARKADLLYQQPVATYQAYNEYPNGTGQNLYEGLTGIPATKVSFDRPYAGVRTNSNGYGYFPRDELNFIKWLEKEGYDVTYSTNIDTHINGSKLKNYLGVITSGHDEYWSKETRDAFENARKNQVNIGVFGANAAFFQVRYEPASDGTPNRTMICYKSSADPVANPKLKTELFRSADVNRPEQTLLGSQYYTFNGFWNETTYTDLFVKNTSHWVFEGAGLNEGDSIPKIVGYEIDNIDPNIATPLSTEFTVIAESPFPDNDNGNLELPQQTVIYRAKSSDGYPLRWVFNAGTMAWSWALDYDSAMASWGFPFTEDRTNAQLQIVTRNILDRFINRPPRGLPSIYLNRGQLTANTGNISDSDGLGAFKYQWKRNNIDIPGETRSKYSLNYRDFGKRITVAVSYTDGLGVSETVISKPAF